MRRSIVLPVAIGVIAIFGIGMRLLRRAESAASVKVEDREAAPQETRPESELAPAEPATPPAATDRPSPAAEASPETGLMDRLRHARAAGQHLLAIQLAREGNRRFPDSSSAPERHSTLIHALADNEQRSEARGEAEFMVNHYPDSAFVREIERFTGAHRHRNVRLSDAGEIEYY
jgi:hypothetical protein